MKTKYYYGEKVEEFKTIEEGEKIIQLANDGGMALTDKGNVYERINYNIQLDNVDTQESKSKWKTIYTWRLLPLQYEFEYELAQEMPF